MPMYNTKDFHKANTIVSIKDLTHHQNIISIPEAPFLVPFVVPHT